MSAKPEEAEEALRSRGGGFGLGLGLGLGLRLGLGLGLGLGLDEPLGGLEAELGECEAGGGGGGPALAGGRGAQYPALEGLLLLLHLVRVGLQGLGVGLGLGLESWIRIGVRVGAGVKFRTAAVLTRKCFHLLVLVRDVDVARHEGLPALYPIVRP